MRTIHLAPIALVVALAACSGGNTPAGNGTTADDEAKPAEAAAPAGDYPRIKAGLWEMKMTMPGPSGKSIDATVKSCVGEPKPGENPFASRTVAGTSCTNDVKAAAGGWDITSECTGNGVSTKTRGQVTGDPQRAYRTVMTSVSTGENVPAYLQQETQTIVEARHLGECPAGVKPGQVVP